MALDVRTDLANPAPAAGLKAEYDVGQAALGLALDSLAYREVLLYQCTGDGGKHAGPIIYTATQIPGLLDAFRGSQLSGLEGRQAPPLADLL
jgi:hypothetical protein